MKRAGSTALLVCALAALPALAVPSLDEQGYLRGVAIAFHVDSEVIQPASLPALEELAVILNVHPELEQVEVRQHRNLGGEKWARDLTCDRARAVVQALVALGVAPVRLSSRGFGASAPPYPLWSRKGRAFNRRTKFVVVRRAGQAALPPCPVPPPARPPDSEAACQAHAGCDLDGRCSWDGQACIVDPAGCSASLLCRESGLCHFKDGRCRALGDADCLASARCRAEGRCGMIDGRCFATVAGCRRSEGCRAEEVCGLRDLQCIPVRASDCQRSTACKQDERCKLRGDLCVQPELPSR